MPRYILPLLLLLILPFTLSAQVGEQAPEFSLKKGDGSTLTLSGLKGKVVVVNFWTTWCPPCRREIPDFIETYKNYNEKGVEIVGVSLDHQGWDVVTPFVKNNSINYPIVLGNVDTAKEYGDVRSIPTSFIVDKEGKIVEKFVGMLTKEQLEEILNKYLD